MIKNALVNIKDDLTEIQKKNPLIISKGGIPLLYDKSENTVYVDATDSHSLIIGSTGSKNQIGCSSINSYTLLCRRIHDSF